jgi:hypothetical protein
MSMPKDIDAIRILATWDGNLPNFVAAEVYGGGTGTGDGLCFDTVQCAIALEVEASGNATGYRASFQGGSVLSY